MVPARRLIVLSVAEHTGSCGSCHPGACQEQASVPVSSVRHAAAVLRHHDVRKRRHPKVLVFKCAASSHNCRSEAARWYKVGAEVGKIGEKYGDTAVEHCAFNLRRMAGIQMTADQEAIRNNSKERRTTTLWVRFTPFMQDNLLVCCPVQLRQPMQ